MSSSAVVSPATEISEHRSPNVCAPLRACASVWSAVPSTGQVNEAVRAWPPKCSSVQVVVSVLPSILWDHE